MSEPRPGSCGLRKFDVGGPRVCAGAMFDRAIDEAERLENAGRPAPRQLTGVVVEVEHDDAVGPQRVGHEGVTARPPVGETTPGRE